MVDLTLEKVALPMNCEIRALNATPSERHGQKFFRQDARCLD